jgi:hypothetical protein
MRSNHGLQQDHRPRDIQGREGCEGGQGGEQGIDLLGNMKESLAQGIYALDGDTLKRSS